MAGQVKRGSISFTADGAEMQARVSTNAMAAYQDKTGEQFVVGLDMLSKEPGDMVRLRNLFWAALVGEYSVSEAGDVMDAVGIAEVVEIIGKAVQAAWPASEGDAGNGNGATAKAPQTAKEPNT